MKVIDKKIDEIDIGRLDASEGYSPGRKENSYRRIELRVFEDGDKKKPLSVWAYEVVDKGVFVPNQEYKNLLVGGLEYWHFPNNYTEQLKQISVE